MADAMRSMTPITGDTIVDGDAQYTITDMYVGVRQSILEYKSMSGATVRVDSPSLEFVSGLDHDTPYNIVWRII